MMTGMRRWLLLVMFSLLPVSSPQAEQSGQHDWLLFLSGGLSYHNVDLHDGREDYEGFADADFLYSYQKENFRSLVEYILSTHENELERAQIGYQFEGESLLWAGRFHSPSRYWNVAYHHGQYLQTSISRPVIEQYEDEGGVLPAHITGLMYESTYSQENGSGILSKFAFGMAPVLGHSELEPFDFIDPGSDHGGSVDILLAYLPDQFEENQFGMVFNWSDINVDQDDINHIASAQNLTAIEQVSVGAYVDWRRDQWRSIANVTHVINDMIMTGQDSSDSFTSAYLQIEYEINLKWTPYARIEETTNKHDSQYLALFPEAILSRQVAGLRFDFIEDQAFSFELAHADRRNDEFRQFYLQWSSVFP